MHHNLTFESLTISEQVLWTNSSRSYKLIISQSFLYLTANYDTEAQKSDKNKFFQTEQMDYQGVRARLKDLKTAELAALRRGDKEAAVRVSGWMTPKFLVVTCGHIQRKLWSHESRKGEIFATSYIHIFVCCLFVCVLKIYGDLSRNARSNENGRQTKFCWWYWWHLYVCGNFVHSACKSDKI